MDSIRRECKRSLAFVLIVMLLTSMMMSVLVLSASAEEDSHLPKVVNVPALTFSGKYETEKDDVKGSNNINTRVFNMVFDQEESDLTINDIQSITYDYFDDDISFGFSGTLNFRVISDFDMVICAFNENVSYQNSWGGIDSTQCYTLKDIISYKMRTSSVADVLASLRRSSLNVTMTYTDGSTSKQRIGLVEDNLYSFMDANGHYAETMGSKDTTETKTYVENGWVYDEEHDQQIYSKFYTYTQYSFSTTGSVNMTVNSGTIGQTLCTLLVKLAHSTNIDNDSIMEMDNAIFDMTEGSATTNRYYVDIDSEENVVLPMNTMSEAVELVQTRIGNNIVYNTESSVDFDRPVEAISDGSADFGRVFTFDHTFGGYVIENVKATDEDMHLLAQRLQQHTENVGVYGSQVEKYATIAELNGQLISLPDELYYAERNSGWNREAWVATSAKSFDSEGKK